MNDGNGPIYAAHGLIRSALAFLVVCFVTIVAGFTVTEVVSTISDEHRERARLAWCAQAVTPSDLASCLQSFER